MCRRWIRAAILTLTTLGMVSGCGGGIQVSSVDGSVSDEDAGAQPDGGEVEPDADVSGCEYGVDPCCDPDGTACDHGCDGTDCYPECAPGVDPCCESDGTACDHGCDGTTCYPDCDPAVDGCCNPDGTSTMGHGVCELGGPLDPTCDPCVDAVCQVDSYCCNNDWDELCLDVVGTEASCTEDCAAGLPSCDDQYGAAPNYVGCDQGAGTCGFNTTTSIDSCAVICASLGGECVDAYNDAADVCSYSNEQTGCNHTGYQTEICMCSRGCGSQAPCVSPAVCTDGQCL